MLRSENQQRASQERRTKQRLEAGGWRVVHGIVDSIWVTPNADVDDEKSSRDQVALAHEEISELPRPQQSRGYSPTYS